MQLICLELSHWQTPVALREQFSFNDKQLCDLYETFLCADTVFDEVAILSTCNRTELVAVCNDDDVTLAQMQHAATRLLTQQHDLDHAVIDAHAVWHCNDDAIAHLCRVASGIESQVVGEPQILGQVIKTHEQATKLRVNGPVLKRVFKTAIRSGKRARAETVISRHAASVGSVSVRLAKQALGTLHGKHVALIGSGAMGQLVAQALRSEGIAELSLLNRTPANAKRLADKFGVTVQGLDALPTLLDSADVIITATASPTYIITQQQMAQMRPDRQPLLLIDIAVPRNIEPISAENPTQSPTITLFDMDALSGLRDNALSERQRAIPEVTAIIHDELALCATALRELTVETTIGDLRQRAEAIRQRELARMLRQLPEAEDQTREQFERFSRSLINKLLHEPTRQLRRAAVDSDSEGTAYDSALRDLFQL